MLAHKKITLFVFIFASIFLEFFRDFLFVNINLQIQFSNLIESGYNAVNYTDSKILEIIKDFSVQKLTILKWSMTLFFFLLFVLIGSLFSFVIWDNNTSRKFTKLYSLSGLTIFGTGFIIYLSSLFLNTENRFNFYYISIELSHFVQSSLYPITFLLVFYAYRKMKIQPKY